MGCARAVFVGICVLLRWRYLVRPRCCAVRPQGGSPTAAATALSLRPDAGSFANLLAFCGASSSTCRIHWPRGGQATTPRPPASNPTTTASACTAWESFACFATGPSCWTGIGARAEDLRRRSRPCWPICCSVVSTAPRKEALIDLLWPEQKRLCQGQRQLLTGFALPAAGAGAGAGAWRVVELCYPRGRLVSICPLEASVVDADAFRECCLLARKCAAAGDYEAAATNWALRLTSTRATTWRISRSSTPRIGITSGACRSECCYAGCIAPPCWSQLLPGLSTVHSSCGSPTGSADLEYDNGQDFTSSGLLPVRAWTFRGRHRTHLSPSD